MQESEQRLTIEELAQLVQLPVRTIRYYIAEHLLPGPGMRGKAATYGKEHVLRLHLIRRLSEQHLPLAEIQTLLAHLSLDEIRALVADKQQAARAQATQEITPKAYIENLLKQAQRNVPSHERPAVSRPAPVPTRVSTVWHHWELAPGVELHIRSDVEDQQRTLLEQLFKAAGITYRSSYRNM